MENEVESVVPATTPLKQKMLSGSLAVMLITTWAWNAYKEYQERLDKLEQRIEKIEQKLEIKE